MVVRVQKHRLSIAGALAGLLLAGSSCGDPVRDNLTQDLGGEAPGVKPGPLHRPGQPCTLCHDAEHGNAEPAFSLAGTVYLDITSNTPLGEVAVTVIDSEARSFTATTNCAGNFFVRPSEFLPTYPIWLEMRAGTIFRSMDTPAFREGSCAACHSNPKGPKSPGQVYLVDDPTVEMPPPSQCR